VIKIINIYTVIFFLPYGGKEVINVVNKIIIIMKLKMILCGLYDMIYPDTTKIFVLRVETHDIYIPISDQIAQEFEHFESEHLDAIYSSKKMQVDFLNKGQQFSNLVLYSKNKGDQYSVFALLVHTDGNDEFYTESPVDLAIMYAYRMWESEINDHLYITEELYDKLILTPEMYIKELCRNEEYEIAATVCRIQKGNLIQSLITAKS
jgi:hypothetical protein